MENLTAVLAFLVALSLATERVTETIKKFPGLSWFLFTKRPDGSLAEHARLAAVQSLAIAIGTFFAYQVPDVLASLLHTPPDKLGTATFFLFGALASGGSGIWNNTLEIVREVKKQKEILTTQQRKLALQPNRVGLP